YSLLMISTLVFDDECQTRLGLPKTVPYPHPYKTCIVLGHVSDKEGKKESKQKGNYTPPDLILDDVAMDFGLRLDEKLSGEQAVIAIEDYEGMDLSANTAEVTLSRQKDLLATIKLTGKKGLPRRVLFVGKDFLAKLGEPAPADVKPVE